MTLYLLYESAFGYALFEKPGLDEIRQNAEAMQEYVTDLARFEKVVKLLEFTPFTSAADALDQCNSVTDGIMTSELQHFLELNLRKLKSGKKHKMSLGVAEHKLGSPFWRPHISRAKAMTMLMSF